MKLVTPEFGTIFWTLVTFLILLFLLGRYAWKPLLALLEERERTVKDGLDAAQKARAEADDLLRKNQEFQASARRETAALLEQGRRESEALRAEILAQARSEAQALVEQGQKQIQYEQRQAMESLRRQVADLAIGAAERLVQRQLDDAKHRELVAEYVRSLPEMGPEASRR
jgi:F-type H+-transporting ATPase subunit b